MGPPAVKAVAALLQMCSESPKLGAVPNPVESVNQPKLAGQSEVMGPFRCG